MVYMCRYPKPDSETIELFRRYTLAEPYRLHPYIYISRDNFVALFNKQIDVVDGGTCDLFEHAEFICSCRVSPHKVYNKYLYGFKKFYYDGTSIRAALKTAKVAKSDVVDFWLLSRPYRDKPVLGIGTVKGFFMVSPVEKLTSADMDYLRPYASFVVEVVKTRERVLSTRENEDAGIISVPDRVLEKWCRELGLLP